MLFIYWLVGWLLRVVIDTVCVHVIAIFITYIFIWVCQYLRLQSGYYYDCFCGIVL